MIQVENIELLSKKERSVLEIHDGSVTPNKKSLREKLSSSMATLAIAGVIAYGCSPNPETDNDIGAGHEGQTEEAASEDIEYAEETNIDNPNQPAPPEFNEDDDMADIFRSLDQAYIDGLCARDTDFLDRHYYHPDSGLSATDRVGHILTELDEIPEDRCFWSGNNYFFHEQEWVDDDSFYIEVRIYPLNTNGQPNGEEFVRGYEIARHNQGWSVMNSELIEHISDPNEPGRLPTSSDLAEMRDQ